MYRIGLSSTHSIRSGCDEVGDKDAVKMHPFTISSTAASLCLFDSTTPSYQTLQARKSAANLGSFCRHTGKVTGFLIFTFWQRAESVTTRLWRFEDAIVAHRITPAVILTHGERCLGHTWR